MSRHTTGLRKLALNALHFSGAGRLMAPLTSGVGVVFMLHRVRPAPPGELGPNRILEVTPEFLDQTIEVVKAKGFDIVSLDDAHARLAEGDFDRRFACFTFDDGYRDNREYAYPIFQRHGVPFAIYVPTDYPDGHGDLWWLKLEAVIAAVEAIDLRIDGVATRLETRTRSQRDEVFARVYWWLRSLAEADARAIVNELCALHGVEAANLCRDLVMGWDELRELCRDPLVTIGAHTRRHMSLAKLSLSEARLEVEESLNRLQKELGRPIRHFSYPYGDETSAGQREFDLVKELGFATAVTTRKGVLFPEHAWCPTGLPRLSLNGDFQSTHYVKVMMTGAPFAFWNAARSLRPGAIAARITGRPRSFAMDTST